MVKTLKNKRGFTLVELLAVIVILALLIVITANTVLPMMNKSREKAMVVYAQKVLNNAQALVATDTMFGNPVADSGSGIFASTSGTDRLLYYRIGQYIMKSNDYVGCVRVDYKNDSHMYWIRLYDLKNKLFLYHGLDDSTNGYNINGKLNHSSGIGKNYLNINDFSDASKFTVVKYTGDYETDDVTADKIHKLENKFCKLGGKNYSVNFTEQLKSANSFVS